MNRLMRVIVAKGPERDEEKACRRWTRGAAGAVVLTDPLTPWRASGSQSGTMHVHRLGRTRTASLALVLVVALLGWGGLSASDWKDVFGGQGLGGWVSMHEARFQPAEGGVQLAGGVGWLRSDREYGDFEFECEVRPRVERYDSGLIFRAGLEGKPWPTEYWLVNLRRDMWGTLVKGTKRVALSTAEGPDIEDETAWTRLKLTVKGAKAALELNGKPAWEFDGIDRARGYVGIQAEERAFDFRKVRIREL